MEAKEIEEYVFPIWVWVAVCLAAILILGGVGIGLYLRHRYLKYFNKWIRFFYINDNTCDYIKLRVRASNKRYDCRTIMLD